MLMLIKIAPREEGTEVTEVVKWIGDKVFYLQTVVGDPGARQLHSLLLGSGQSQCLSCNTQEMLPKLRNRPKCQFVSTSMSKVTTKRVLTNDGNITVHPTGRRLLHDGLPWAWASLLLSPHNSNKLSYGGDIVFLSPTNNKQSKFD